MDSSAQAPAPAHNAVNAENVEDAAPPVQAEARNHGGGHQAQNSDNHHHGEHFHAKVAQRQSYLSSLAASRDALNSHFLERRSSSLDLDRYFVRLLSLPKDLLELLARILESLTVSVVVHVHRSARATSTSTPNGPSSSGCTAASCPR